MSSLAVSSTKAPEPSDLYFKSHKPLVVELIGEHMNARSSLYVSKDVATKVAEYLIGERDIFGRDAWLRHWECDVVDPEHSLVVALVGEHMNSHLTSDVSKSVAELVAEYVVGRQELDPFEYTRFWFGPDPKKPGKQVYDTHIPPVLRPQAITHIPTETSYHYSLNILGKLIQAPKEGHPSRYYNYDTAALRQNGKTKAGPACWLTMRKDDVFARNKPYIQGQQAIRAINTRTGVRYEKEPSALDLATGVSAHQVVTGERCLGDITGTERRWTYSLSGDTVSIEDRICRVVVGGNAPLAVGGGAPARLDVSNRRYDYAHVGIGIAGLRKDWAIGHWVHGN